VFSELPSELPDLKQIPEILEWAMGIMMPQGLPDADADELPWMYAQGMIHDDSPALGARKEKIAYAIRNNQLPSGGWPHQFGTYNAVWAAILITKFLQKNKFIRI